MKSYLYLVGRIEGQNESVFNFFAYTEKAKVILFFKFMSVVSPKNMSSIETVYANS